MQIFHNRDKRGSYTPYTIVQNNEEKGDDVWLCKVKAHGQCLRDFRVGSVDILMFLFLPLSCSMFQTNRYLDYNHKCVASNFCRIAEMLVLVRFYIINK